MASSLTSAPKGWVHPRTRPALPPRVAWEIVIKKYAPPYFLTLLQNGNPTGPFISCHRTLYDRAEGKMENSLSGYQNGISQDFMGHEIDGRIFGGVNIGAHDEVADRITDQTGHFNRLPVDRILAMPLVVRKLTQSGDGYALDFEETGDKVPLLDDLLQPRVGQTVQIDMRKTDFAPAVAWLCRRPLDYQTGMLKGYNFNYDSFEDVDTAAKAGGAPDNWADLIAWTFVFHTEPITKAAFRSLGIDPDGVSPDQYQSLTYELVHEIASLQIRSFVNNGHAGVFIPEIGFSGLGLGYDRNTGEARNPYDGVPISDPKVIANALIDRVLIDIALELKGERPNLKLGSCMRLYDAATPDGRKYVSNLETGKAEPWPVGEARIGHFLRSIPGGLYPESDFCNADDPFGEMAARAWVEHGKLDRSDLLRIPYLEWIKQAGLEVENALKTLGGPFLPNTFEL